MGQSPSANDSLLAAQPAWLTQDLTLSLVPANAPWQRRPLIVGRVARFSCRQREGVAVRTGCEPVPARGLADRRPVNLIFVLWCRHPCIRFLRDDLSNAKCLAVSTELRRPIDPPPAPAPCTRYLSQNSSLPRNPTIPPKGLNQGEAAQSVPFGHRTSPRPMGFFSLIAILDTARGLRVPTTSLRSCARLASRDAC